MFFRCYLYYKCLGMSLIFYCSFTYALILEQKALYFCLQIDLRNYRPAKTTPSVAESTHFVAMLLSCCLISVLLQILQQISTLAAKFLVRWKLQNDFRGKFEVLSVWAKNRIYADIKLINYLFVCLIIANTEIIHGNII